MKFNDELKAMGFDLKQWLGQPEKSFIFSELGLGGGISRCGDTPATTRTQAGLWSNLDVGYPWTAKTDPWSKPDIRVGGNQGSGGLGVGQCCGGGRAGVGRMWSAGCCCGGLGGGVGGWASI